MSPKIIDKSKKSLEIARAALGLFSRNGYTSTSVRQIAEEAGIGKGTLYEYYANKEEIFLGAVNEWMADFDKLVFTRLDRIEGPVDKLYAVIELKTEFWNPADMATARMIMEMLKHTIMKGGVIYARRYIMKEYHSKMQKIVVDILLEGISKGIFKPEIARDIEKIPINFLAYADAIGWHCTLFENVDLKEQIDFYMKSMIESLCIDVRMTGDRELPDLAKP
jgi:AcrR family transcriptional regulator